jgi:endonuclease III
MKRTGWIWKKSAKARGQVVRRVCETLKKAYGLPRHGNPDQPLDDLAYVLISNRTPPQRAQRVYESLKRAFPTWEDVAQADVVRVADVLKPAGLSLKKARQLQSILGRINADFGNLEASDLWQKTDTELLAYLVGLPGVSDKVARCVMTYTLDRKVLPVDVHVHRVAFRLGWTARRRPEQSHDELEALVPPDRRYSFHVTCIAHGRALCVATRPKCPPCPIKRWCRYYAEVFEPSRVHED